MQVHRITQTHPARHPLYEAQQCIFHSMVYTVSKRSFISIDSKKFMFMDCFMAVLHRVS